MGARDPKKMREGLSKAQMRSYAGCVFENPLPTNDEEFEGSEFYWWINRLEEGAQRQLQPLEKILNGIPDHEEERYVEMYDEDIVAANSLSNDMYAAMCVHIFSKIENALKECAILWVLKGKDSVDINTTSLEKRINEFSKIIKIDLKSFEEFNYANAVRLLSNSYKHNDRVYIVKEEKENKNDNNEEENNHKKIPKSLCAEWRIKENVQISYNALPMKDIIIKCGLFLKDMLGEFRKKIEEPQ